MSALFRKGSTTAFAESFRESKCFWRGTDIAYDRREAMPVCEAFQLLAIEKAIIRRMNRSICIAPVAA